MAGGRPTILNDELIQLAADAVKRLYYIDAVADYLQITRKNIYNWLQRGEDDIDDESSIYRKFLLTLKKAQADAKMELLGKVADGQGANWQAKAWILERCFPREFGKRDKMELTGKDGGPIRTEYASIPDDKLDARIQALLDAGQDV